jgi:hypothetical protein
LAGKYDLVLWAKNGESTLPHVLRRSSEVIPNELISQRILVDDHSVDRSKDIAKDFGWTVYPNESGGIGNGAKIALRHVTQERFISLEQDVMLARDWFERIPRYLDRDDIAVAQGWRISNHPVIGKIDEYSMNRFRSQYSIDNNVYKTRIIRSLGGFPGHLKYPGVDAYLRRRILNAGLTWIIDNSVLSIHLRKGGLSEQMRRYYGYGMAIPALSLDSAPKDQRDLGLTLRRSAAIALFSPARGLEIALKKRCPKVVYYYPLMRLSHFTGCFKSYAAGTQFKLAPRTS